MSRMSILFCCSNNWISSLCWVRPLAFHNAIRRNLAIIQLAYEHCYYVEDHVILLD